MEKNKKNAFNKSNINKQKIGSANKFGSKHFNKSNHSFTKENLEKAKENIVPELEKNCQENISNSNSVKDNFDNHSNPDLLDKKEGSEKSMSQLKDADKIDEEDLKYLEMLLKIIGDVQCNNFRLLIMDFGLVIFFNYQ